MGARFTFGKFRGVLVEDVPTSYLRWVVAKCECIDLWLLEAVWDELHFRGVWVRGARRPAQRAPTRSPAAVAAGDWSAVISAWYREMSLKYHPDRGGSNEAMQAINDAYKHLKQLAGG